MAVKASASVTLSWSAGILATIRYYQLASPTSATPAVPTSSGALGSWSETEPAADVTKVLWTCERTVYADGTESWSKASKSTSYEAAKDAKGTANAASSTASAAKSTVDGMKIGGRNLLKGTSMDSKAVTTPTTANTTWGFGFYFPKDASLRAVIPYGAEYRCSADVLLPVDGRIVINMNTYAESGTSWSGDDNDNTNRRTADPPTGQKTPVFNVKANVWTRLSWGSENTNAANTGKQAIYINDSVGLLPQSAAVTWHYRGLKVELGNKATGWTPAPEDTDSAVADAKKAGTDAQTSANSAQKAADKAQSSADRAQGTADDAWSRTLRVQVSSAPADAAGDTSTLTATVWRGGQQLMEQEVAMMGLVKWYVGDSCKATGWTYTCAAGTAVECRLEA